MRKFAFVTVWLFVLALPTENIFLFPGIGTLSRLFGFVAFVVGGYAVFALREQIRIHPLHMLIGVFVLWAVCTFYWSLEQEYTLDRIWTYFQILLMTWMIYQWTILPRQLDALLGAYVLGAYASGFSTILSYLSGEMAYWQRYSASGFNPNDLASILALGIPMAWYICQKSWGGKLKWIFFLYPFFAPVCIALTGSRSGLVASLIALLFVCWTFPRMPGYQKLAAGLATGVSALVGMLFVPPESWARLATTGEELVVGGWNFRMVIWEAGLKVFANNPFVGVGAGAFRPGVAAYLGEGAASHNVFLAILVEQGFVGLIIFLTVLLVTLFGVLRMPALERSLWLVMLATWGATAFAHPWEWRKQTWLIFVLAVTHAVALARQRLGAQPVAASDLETTATTDRREPLAKSSLPAGRGFPVGH